MRVWMCATSSLGSPVIIVRCVTTPRWPVPSSFSRGLRKQRANRPSARSSRGSFRRRPFSISTSRPLVSDGPPRLSDWREVRLASGYISAQLTRPLLQSCHTSGLSPLHGEFAADLVSLIRRHQFCTIFRPWLSQHLISATS